MTGDIPNLFCESELAPYFNNASKTSTCPSCEANIKAVQFSLVLALGFAPC